MSFFNLLRAPDFVSVTTDDGVFRLERGAGDVWGALGAGVEVEVVALSEPSGDGGREVRLRETNASARPQRLHLRWKNETPPLAGARFLGDHWERGYGDLQWLPLSPDRLLPWYVVGLSASGECCGVGVAVNGVSFCHFRVDAGGVSLFVDVRCGGRGVALGARELCAATLLRYEGEPGESPFAVTRNLCRKLAGEAKPRVPPQPVYGANDWYYIYGRNSRDTVLRDADITRDLSPLADQNAPFQVIDAGWQAAGSVGGGPWDAASANFAGGMARLAGEIKARGVRPGIWMRPLLAQSDDDVIPASWRLPAAHPWPQKGPKPLDPSVPEVRERVARDVAQLTQEWGYELLKHDFSTFDVLGRWGFQMVSHGIAGAEGDATLTTGDWTFADTARTSAEIIRDLYETIARAAGSAVVIGCNTVGHLCVGACDLSRTGDDTSGREWDRTRKMGVNTLAFRAPQHGAFFQHDADCVGLTSAIAWNLNRQWLDLLARSGTPLFVSADPAALGPHQRSALRDAFARASVLTPPAEPLDWLDTSCPQTFRFGDGETKTYDWFDGDGLA